MLRRTWRVDSRLLPACWQNFKNPPRTASTESARLITVRQHPHHTSVLYVIGMKRTEVDILCASYLCLSGHFHLRFACLFFCFVVNNMNLSMRAACRARSRSNYRIRTEHQDWPLHYTQDYKAAKYLNMSFFWTAFIPISLIKSTSGCSPVTLSFILRAFDMPLS